MEILSPLRGLEEIEPLLQAGADQFYCGMIHPDSKLNNRPNQAYFNFQSPEELSEAVSRIHNNHKKLYLTLNNPYGEIQPSLDQANQALEIGVDGVIVVSIWLMHQIATQLPKLPLWASCLTGSLNGGAIEFLKQFHIKGIHLPRHIGLAELAQLIPKQADIQLSVFGMEGLCVNIEAFCYLHDLGELEIMPCQFMKTVSIAPDESTCTKQTLDKKILAPKIGCGMCAVKQLMNIDVPIMKIEGRHLPLEEKIKRVQCIQNAKQWVHLSDEAYVKQCRQFFKESFLEACKPEYCYF